MACCVSLILTPFRSVNSHQRICRDAVFVAPEGDAEGAVGGAKRTRYSKPPDRQGRHLLGLSPIAGEDDIQIDLCKRVTLRPGLNKSSLAPLILCPLNRLHALSFLWPHHHLPHQATGAQFVEPVTLTIVGLPNKDLPGAVPAFPPLDRRPSGSTSQPYTRNSWANS